MRANMTDSNIIFLNRYLGQNSIEMNTIVFGLFWCYKSASILLNGNSWIKMTTRTCITEEKMLAPFKNDLEKWYGSTRKVINIYLTYIQHIRQHYKGFSKATYKKLKLIFPLKEKKQICWIISLMMIMPMKKMTNNGQQWDTKVFSCPEQLNRWPCHWVTFWFWHYRVTIETLGFVQDFSRISLDFSRIFSRISLGFSLGFL